MFDDIMRSTTFKPRSTTPYYDSYTMDNRTKAHFNSLFEAKNFMKQIDIADSPRIIIHYKPFPRNLPKFISEEDEELFSASDRNQEYLQPMTNVSLRGVIEVIPNGTFQMEWTCGYKSDYDYVRQNRTHTPGYSYDIVVPLVIPMGFLFQHFLDGTMPKLLQAYEFIRRDNVHILLERPKHHNVYHLLDVMGIPPQKVIWHIRGDTSTVYHANYMIMICIAPPLHPVLWARLRHLLGVKNQLPVSINTTKVMLLTRAGAVNGGRNVINNQQLEEFLQNRYNSSLMIFDGSCDLRKAIEVFSHVRIIIGPHGGAFYNLMYASLNATVIEFAPVLKFGQDIRSLPHAIFWALADMLGQPYWRMECQSQNFQHDMRVDIHKLERILDIVDRQYV